MGDHDRRHPGKGRCVALFPGAFRPPHAAHLAAVQNLVSRPDVDEVVVIIANRSRQIPDTTKALDARVARRIWKIYLEDVANVRIETAPHAAVRHALGYFDRVRAGDRLMFCVGWSDFIDGDTRFETIRALSRRTGIAATVCAAPTGSFGVRATPLRAALASGEAGREAFVAALPDRLTARQRDRVWAICRTGMREIGAIVSEKIATLFDGFALGELADLDVVRAGKMDPVCCARLADGRRLFVKYAGDTVEAGSLGEATCPKPCHRLAAERRALTVLRTRRPSKIRLPEVVHFDKETRTLVMTDACPGGRPLQDELRRGAFDPDIACLAGGFLAECHGLSEGLRPLWGDEAADLRHWRRMLASCTVALADDRMPQVARRGLESLMQASLRASGRYFLHLDYSPKNILVGDDGLGIIDFERAASVGDPACDLGCFLGHYVLWGLRMSARRPCQDAIGEALGAYRLRGGDLSPDMGRRVVAFAGASLLQGAAGDRRTGIAGSEDHVASTATALLATDPNSADDPAHILSDAVAGRFAS